MAGYVHIATVYLPEYCHPSDYQAQRGATSLIAMLNRRASAENMDCYDSNKLFDCSRTKRVEDREDVPVSPTSQASDNVNTK